MNQQTLQYVRNIEAYAPEWASGPWTDHDKIEFDVVDCALEIAQTDIDNAEYPECVHGEDLDLDRIAMIYINAWQALNWSKMQAV